MTADLRITIHEYGARGHQSGRGAGDTDRGSGQVVRVKGVEEQPDDERRTHWLMEESRAYARFRRSLGK